MNSSRAAAGRMALRNRTKLSSSTGRSNAPIDVTAASPIAAQQAKLPVTGQFHIVIDRQLKSAYTTQESAKEAALAIKGRYPHLQVSIYNDREKGHVIITGQEPNTNPNKQQVSASIKRVGSAGHKH